MSNDAQAWIDQGRQQFSVWQFAEALDSFEQAIAADPTHAEAWNGKAVALRNLNRVEEAQSALDRALELDPNLPRAWFNKGLLLEENLNRPTEAADCYRRAFQLQLDLTEAQRRYQNLIQLTQVSEQAVTVYASSPSAPKPSSQASAEAERWSNQGFQKYMTGDFVGAIASWEQAIALKPDFHEAWSNRGLVLYALGRYEEAIASCDQAIEFKPNNDAAWNNRGLALHALGWYEEAIASCDQAIEITPDFHGAWGNRGNSLSASGRKEEAIASYDQLLKIKPDDHQAWNNRGNSLFALGRKEEAIASFDQALEIKTDYHEAWNNRGLVLSALGRNEEAIASNDRAIALKFDYWQAWANRGNAAVNSSQCKTSVRWTLPEPLQNFALDQRGYAGALACYAAGLRQVEREQQPEGWGQLHRLTGRAHYFHHRFATQQGAMIWEAVREYHLALEVLTADAFPEAHLKTLQDLIRAELSLGNTDTARHWQIQGVAVLQALLNQSPTWKKRQLEFQFYSFRQMTVDLLVQEGQLALALQEAERDKNRCLNWMLAAWAEPQWSPAVAQMRAWLEAGTSVVYWHLSPDALTTFVLRADAPDPWVLPDGELTAGRLPPSRQQRRDLEAWVNAWNSDYEDYRLKGKEVSPYQRQQHPWRRQLAERLAHLRDLLRLPELEAQLTGISRLILVPHQDLHRFPLHMLFDPHFTVSYLPSLQVGITQKARNGFTPLSTQSHLLSLEAPAHNDLEPLKYSKIESALIARLFASSTRLPTIGESDKIVDATHGVVSHSLITRHNLLHFTGHGAYNAQQPHLSYLALSGDDVLTVERINQIDLFSYSLVCLASCETAATGLQMLEVEYVGLASAFLRAGVAQVVSSLWLVDEVSSTYFMLYFYERLLSPGQLTPAAALRAAQDWLRQITYPELVQWLQQVAQRLGDREPERMAQAIREDQDKINATEPPFADPYYWATFILTGNLTP